MFSKDVETVINNHDIIHMMDSMDLRVQSPKPWTLPYCRFSKKKLQFQSKVQQVEMQECLVYRGIGRSVWGRIFPACIFVVFQTAKDSAVMNILQP